MVEAKDPARPQAGGLLRFVRPWVAAQLPPRAVAKWRDDAAALSAAQGDSVSAAIEAGDDPADL
jgi:hypothetical protein